MILATEAGATNLGGAGRDAPQVAPAPSIAGFEILASLGRVLPRAGLALVVESNIDTLRGMDAFDRFRVEAAIAAWREKHPGVEPPAFPWGG